MIIIFDLDDTLYEEMTFVKGGMRAVSNFLKDHLQESPELIYEELMNILILQGRNKIFDTLLKKKNKFKKYLVSQCINRYRYHKPSIKLHKQAIDFLKSNKFKNLYLVTDGNKKVQFEKVKALNIKKFFKKIFITHRYGIKNAKPSLYCFNKIKQMENCSWEDIVYIGDNPEKDFISLKKVKAKTIRVLTGNYSDYITSEIKDADYTINSLNELGSLLKKIFN